MSGFTLKHVLSKGHTRAYACDAYEQVTDESGDPVLLLRRAGQPEERVVVDRGRVFVENQSGRTICVVGPSSQAKQEA